MQCGRRVDALKLWIEWKSCGTSGWRKRVENYVELAIELEELVVKHPNLELVCERAFTNVCLRYRGEQQDESNLNLFNQKIRGKMMHEGRFMVSLATVEDKTVLRAVICNPAVDSESLIRFVEEIIRVANTID